MFYRVCRLCWESCSLQAHFQKYYDAVMPYLKNILIGANDKQNRMLRAKSMECISLVGMAVGKDKFREDAKQVIVSLCPMLKLCTSFGIFWCSAFYEFGTKFVTDWSVRCWVHGLSTLSSTLGCSNSLTAIYPVSYLHLGSVSAFS